MTRDALRFPAHEILPGVTHTTLGAQVRAEAVRRGGEWVAVADQRAALAVKWYGRRPLKGEDLRIVFDEVFRER